MARPLRLEFEGAIYYLLGRGNARQRIFASERSQGEFLKTLASSVPRFVVAVHGFVLTRDAAPPQEICVSLRNLGTGVPATNIA